MTADAADPTETDNGLPAGTLAYSYTEAQITGGFAPQTIAYGQQTTLSGQLTGIPPAGGQPVGIGGEPVYLRDLRTNTEKQIATTASDGTYSATVTPVSPSYVVRTHPTSDLDGTLQSAGIPISFTSAYPTRITATVTPQDFIYGSVGEATVTGTAEY